MSIIETKIIPAIDQRFGLSRRDSILLNRPIELPKINIGSITLEKRQAMLDMSIYVWNRVYYPEKFQAVLQQDISQQQREYLKRVRKFGVMMRASYAHLSEQELPDSLRRFVKRLGVLNDKYYTEAEPQLRQELYQLSQVTPQLSEDTTPTVLSDEAFHQKMKKTITNVRTALEASELPFDDFHELRKRVRHFQNVILLFHLIEGESSDLEKIYAHGANFITRMGDVTDERYANGTTDQPVQLSSSLKYAATSYIDAFQL